mmetsp:Transcript_31977/g.49945  ORF Transcript_31977/g.49945 Transcript_31977/m.49945 type:complete len:495 (-) Transcript_31977:225-1709(-)|eukprot:CAMPEP_0184288302 /NCGR_PEP_ID=MMETSP1049-20130417/818_1 /TAXON_ID=77928 /ORGANISM="Proteomonas sulcata, Strain CCMP704" /LENGTH=494 /DNA_ID=CAMNT_0026594621 /DNA_START=39 /DNA_END=1523 /DNA_ORIENTATION=-
MKVIWRNGGAASKLSASSSAGQASELLLSSAARPLCPWSHRRFSSSAPQRLSSSAPRLLSSSAPQLLGSAISKSLSSSASFSSRRFLSSSSSPSSVNILEPSEDHQLLRKMVRDFAEAEVDPQAMDFNRIEKFNVPLFKKLGELGLLGITVPEEYGGSGSDAVAACIAHEELSAADPAFCLSYLAHSLLFVNNLARNGSEEQKHKYLPAACSGDLIGGMCMSEPDAGTDVLGMKTTAKSGGDHYVLNGTKMWITNGTIDGESTGDIFLVYAKTQAADGSEGLSLFLVEKGTEGFKLGQQIKDKCGMRASMTAELVFDNCKIPAENLVGKEAGAVSCMMRNLEIERLCLAAMSCGIAKRSVERMAKYAQERKAFGKSLASFGQIQRLIGDSYASMSAGRAFLYQTAIQHDLDNDPEVTGTNQRIETDAVKLFCCKMGKDCADSAIQVLGGNGYVGDYQVERLWRDAKLLEIGGGTNEAHHKNIARDLSRKDSGRI